MAAKAVRIVNRSLVSQGAWHSSQAMRLIDSTPRRAILWVIYLEPIRLAIHRKLKIQRSITSKINVHYSLDTNCHEFVVNYSQIDCKSNSRQNEIELRTNTETFKIQRSKFKIKYAIALYLFRCLFAFYCFHAGAGPWRVSQERPCHPR